jgi:hypothetical protein
MLATISLVANAAAFLPAFLSKPPAAAAQLRDSLVAGVRDMGTLTPLVDECVAARAPFKAELLGDGELWRAVSIVRGETPRWERSARLLPFLSNRAGQAYTLAGAGGSGTVVNYGEVLGRALYFKASGSFSRAPSSSGDGRCPQDFNVAIDNGGFVAGGREFVSDAISGPGFLRCLYIDGDIRIFESPTDSPDRWEEAGLVVVQVRDELFRDPVAGAL